MWPAPNKESEWWQFNEDMDVVHEVTFKGKVDSSLQKTSTLTISITLERFVFKEQRVTKTITGSTTGNGDLKINSDKSSGHP